nr:ATP-binding protein [Luteibacter rhizovicinus]
MLIQFSVQNYRSIRSKQVLSMVAGRGDEHREANTAAWDGAGFDALVKTAVMYGPNAAGKSNFIQALNSMRRIVLTSANDSQRDDDLDVEPYVLSSETLNEPTEFELMFLHEGVRYQYGFTATTQHIVDEWLFAFPKGKPQKWIERTWNFDSESFDWGKMSSLTGQKQLWIESTRRNSLFLSTAVQLNSKALQPVFDWISKYLRTGRVAGFTHSYTAKMCLEAEAKLKVLAFMEAADLGISDIEVEEEEIPLERHFHESVSEKLKADILSRQKSRSVYEVKLAHESEDGSHVYFDFRDESDGTRRFFSFIGPWIDTLENGRTIILDELNASLHPTLVKFLVSVFHNPFYNKSNAQLIFTTHETSILSQDVFRRDQVWFFDKKVGIGTELFPLTDFRPRKGREDLEASYLSGRYGALPFIAGGAVDEAF